MAYFFCYMTSQIFDVYANPISNPYIEPNFVRIKYPIKYRLTRNMNCKRKTLTKFYIKYVKTLTVKYVVIF